MKKLVLMLAIGLCLLALSSSSKAEWIRLSWSESGNWVVSDQVLEEKAGCKTVVVAMGYKQAREHARGKLAGKKAVMEVCCPAGTVRTLGINLIGPKGESFQRYQVKEAAYTPAKDTVALDLVGMVCSKGFGGQAAKSQ